MIFINAFEASIAAFLSEHNNSSIFLSRKIQARVAAILFKRLNELEFQLDGHGELESYSKLNSKVKVRV